MTDAPLTPQEEDQALAGEYVTGLLSLAERSAVEARLRRDPAFAALVAALRPGRETLVNPAGNGIAAGAARLCSHGSAPAPLTLHPLAPLPGLPDLTDYAARWRVLAKDIPT